MKYDRPSFTWVSDEEMARRTAERMERIFQRKANQGEPCAPMIATDTMGLHGVQSQVDGKHYDSKTALRAHYRQAGVTEVGNEPLGPGQRFVDPQKDRKQEHAIDKAFSRAGIAP